MATRSLKPAIGDKLAQAAKIVLDAGGGLSAQVINSINQFQENVVRKVNGRISFGTGAQSTWAGNIYGQWVEFTTPSSADVEFVVDHGLNSVPFARFVGRQDTGAHLYDSNINSWGPDKIYLKCSEASVLMKILILASPGAV